MAAGSLTGANVKDHSIGAADLASFVMARPSANTPVSTGDGGANNPVTYPLLHGTWTQRAKVANLFVGQVTFTVPSTCTQGLFALSIYLGDTVLTGTIHIFNPDDAGLVRTTLLTPTALVEPPVNTPRSLTAKIYDTCPNAGESYTVDSVKIEVIALQ